MTEQERKALDVMLWTMLSPSRAGQVTFATVAEFVDSLIASEREECAKLFDKFTYGPYNHPSDAIRARARGREFDMTWHVDPRIPTAVRDADGTLVASTGCYENDRSDPDVLLKTQEANARLIAEAPNLLTVVMSCATTFRHYESLHAAKGTEDGRQKAQANGDMATLCDNVIAKATGS